MASTGGSTEIATASSVETSDVIREVRGTGGVPSGDPYLDHTYVPTSQEQDTLHRLFDHKTCDRRVQEVPSCRFDFSYRNQDELDQADSGMESLTASKDDTPERRPEDNIFTSNVIASTPDSEIVPSAALKEYDDEPDETLSERLWGLTEMFPECVRESSYALTTKSWSGLKSLYGFSRSVMWIVASSSVILFAPVIFEVERAQVEEMQKTQQKQVLLGTNTAMSGPMPSMPPMPR